MAVGGFGNQCKSQGCKILGELTDELSAHLLQAVQQGEEKEENDNLVHLP